MCIFAGFVRLRAATLSHPSDEQADVMILPNCLQIDVSWVFVMLFSLSLPLLSNWVELITGSRI